MAEGKNLASRLRRLSLVTGFYPMSMTYLRAGLKPALT